MKTVTLQGQPTETEMYKIIIKDCDVKFITVNDGNSVIINYTNHNVDDSIFREVVKPLIKWLKARGFKIEKNQSIEFGKLDTKYEVSKKHFKFKSAYKELTILKTKNPTVLC